MSNENCSRINRWMTLIGVAIFILSSSCAPASQPTPEMIPNTEAVSSFPRKPLNLYWDFVDDNGIPLNPMWGWQIEHQGLPDYYPDTSLFYKSKISSFTDQKLYEDYGYWGCGPHVNWGIPVTFRGILKWDSHSAYWNDDDYNFFMFAPGGAGATKRKDNIGGIVCEFDSDETIDYFNTPWWDKFHKAVDESEKMPLTTKARELPHQMVDGKEAIVTGYWGLDCAHEDCSSEIHPVWFMAIHVKDDPEDDTWSMFARNWGNEGYCGQSQHNILFPSSDNLYLYNFRIPWRNGAIGVDYDINNYRNNFRTNNENVKMGLTVTNEGIIVRFFLTNPNSQSRVNGELHLKWIYPVESTPQSYSDQLSLSGASLNETMATGKKESEEEEIYQMLIEQVPVEKRIDFEWEYQALFDKGIIEADNLIPQIWDYQENLFPPISSANLQEVIIVSPDSETVERTKQLEELLNKYGVNLQFLQSVTPEP